MAESPLTLSVVVISWNQAAFLRRLVTQLLTQDYDPTAYEIIVVDDGSTDGSREWLREQRDSRLKTIFGDSNRGRAAARNAGIRTATGKIVVMIDGDHSVNPDYLSVHAARHVSERCVVVGLSHFVDRPDFRALNSYLNHGGASKLPPNTPLPGRYFLTRNCSAPRDLLFAVGLFDERYHAWGGEDLDLGVRLEESGVPLYGEPGALAIHHHLRPLNELLANLYRYGRDGIPVLLKRHPRLYRELNLHHLFPPSDDSAGTNAWHRAAMRFVMISPIFYSARSIANLFRRRRLPRALFDYLHLRQYARGYRDYLRAHQGD
jgi:glycosyltransferase involved in cell wall biosynthesis